MNRRAKMIALLVLAVFFLTAADFILTAAGVRMGVISEGNPLLQGAMNRPIVTACAVCPSVGGLLIFVYRFGRQYKYTAPLLAGVCVVKLAVMGLHLGWLLAL